VFAGGCVRKWVESRAGERKSEQDSGILCASGFVAGEGLAGVGVAGWAWYAELGRASEPVRGSFELVLALALLGVAALALLRASRSNA
jgi:hypothetical protein